jgi:thiazole biosynthesis protein thiG
MLLTTKQAFDIAIAQNVFLKALTPNANGVIGALAGIGLRLSGSDGKIRGKFELEKSNLSVCELLRLNFVEAVVDENFKSLLLDERVNLIGALKPVFLDFKATLLVKKESDGGFRNLSVKELRDF